LSDQRRPGRHGISAACHRIGRLAIPDLGVEGFVSFSNHTVDELDAAILAVLEEFEREESGWRRRASVSARLRS
jgi:hypothetical protein